MCQFVFNNLWAALTPLTGRKAAYEWLNDWMTEWLNDWMNEYQPYLIIFCSSILGVSNNFWNVLETCSKWLYEQDFINIMFLTHTPRRASKLDHSLSTVIHILKTGIHGKFYIVQKLRHCPPPCIIVIILYFLCKDL